MGKDTLAAALCDVDMQIAEKKAQRKANIQRLREILEVIDLSGDGEISFEEFQHFFSYPNVQAYFSMLDVQVYDLDFLFHLLDADGDGCISEQEFIDGVMRIKGGALQQDVFHIVR